MSTFTASNLLSLIAVRRNKQLRAASAPGSLPRFCSIATQTPRLPRTNLGRAAERLKHQFSDAGIQERGRRNQIIAAFR
jgi:hypothetical protein